MAGSPNPVRTQVVKLALESAPIVLSGTTAILATNADFAGACFRPVRLFGTVVAAVTVAAGSVVVAWRPTVASATNARHIATFTVPVSSIDTLFEVPLTSAGATTVINAGGPTSQYGIGGSTRYEGEDEDNMIMGPGGEISMTPGGESTAGSIDLWMEVELLSQVNEKQTNAIQTIVPSSVGV